MVSYVSTIQAILTSSLIIGRLIGSKPCHRRDYSKPWRDDWSGLLRKDGVKVYSGGVTGDKLK